MKGLQEHAEEFCDRAELLLTSLGLGLDLYSDSKVEYYVGICCELRETGRLDISKCHTMDLFHFTNAMIQLAKAIEADPTLGWYEWESNGDVSGLLDLMYLGLGYALIYEQDSSVMLNNTDSMPSDFTRAMASVARMKVSSFRSAISLAGIALSSIDNCENYEKVISFVKSRRGFKPLEIHDGEALQDNYKFIYSDKYAHSNKFLARTLISRAKWRKIKSEQLYGLFDVSTNTELASAIVLPENATTVAKLLSLDVKAYISYLQCIELEEETVAIAKKYTELSKIPSRVVASDTKNCMEKITSEEFIELVANIGCIHPSYGSNKKMMGMILNNGKEIGVDISVSKSVTCWLNAVNKDSILEPYIKAEYDQVSEDDSKYGRHSGLRIYKQLAFESVIKLSIKTIDDAKKILKHLAV